MRHELAHGELGALKADDVADWHSDDDDLFGVLCRNQSEWLLSPPEIGEGYKPSSIALKGRDWDFIVCESDCDERHSATLITWVSRRATLPIEKISLALEDPGKQECAKALEAVL